MAAFINESELRELVAELSLRGGDSTTVEVKAARGGLPENLPETICAFANMPDGGLIILGIDERDNFVISGVERPAELEAGIVSQARKAITPPASVDVATVEVEGKFVVAARVHGLPLRDKPARYRGEAYLRMADGDYRLKPSEIRMIEVAQLHTAEAVSYDSVVIPGTGIEDLDSGLVAQFLAKVRSRNRRLAHLENDEDILRALSVTTAIGELTLAGLYALGFYPQGKFPSLAVTVAQRLPDGTQRGRVRDLETFEGPVPVLLHSVMRWLEDHIGVMRRYREDGAMVEVPELPMEALREAVANALVHRDLGPNTLGAGKAIDVRVLPDKVVVSSPGGLRDLTVERLRSADLARQEVNQRLYSLCRYLETEDGAAVIEGEGGGVHMMLESARREGLPEPDLIDTGVQFTVKVWRPEGLQKAPSVQNSIEDPGLSPVERSLEFERRFAPLGVNAPVVAELLSRMDKPMQMKEIAAVAGLSQGQARYAVNALKDAGYVTMVGEQGSRSTSYVWAEQAG